MVYQTLFIKVVLIFSDLACSVRIGVQAAAAFVTWSWLAFCCFGETFRWLGCVKYQPHELNKLYVQANYIFLFQAWAWAWAWAVTMSVNIGSSSSMHSSIWMHDVLCSYSGLSQSLLFICYFPDWALVTRKIPGHSPMRGLVRRQDFFVCALE